MSDRLCLIGSSVPGSLKFCPHKSIVINTAYRLMDGASKLLLILFELYLKLKMKCNLNLCCSTHLHNEPIDKCTFCFDVSVEQKNYLTCWNCRSYSSLGSLILAKDDITRKEIVDKLFVISFRTRFASFLGGKRGTFRRQARERLNDGTVGSRVRVPFLLYLFPLPSVKKVTFHSSTK